jgi:hypothetical protein
MYAFAERIFDKVPARTVAHENGHQAENQQKKSGKRAGRGQKTAFLEAFGPIVTLWQQWGENFPFTSTFTQRNACF